MFNIFMHKQLSFQIKTIRKYSTPREHPENCIRLKSQKQNKKKFLDFSKVMASTQRQILRLLKTTFRSQKASPYHSGNVRKQLNTGYLVASVAEQQTLDFQNHDSDIFNSKSSLDILRALLVLKICKYEVFTDNSIQLYQVGRKLLGRRLVDNLARRTFYAQFCGGDTETELKQVAAKLEEANIGSQLAAVIEDPADPNTATREFYDGNLDKLLKSTDIISHIDKRNPRVQIRVTALLPGLLMAKITTELKNRGPECLPVEELAESLTTGKQRIHDCLSLAENQILHEGLIRFREIGKKLQSTGVRTQVDAEYTCMNPAFTAVVKAMSLVFNRNTPLVWNTFQCYLKNARENLEDQIQFAERHRLTFGAKIVRGAYIQAETNRAREQGVESPVCESYEKTGEMYDAVVERMLGLVKSKYPDYHVLIAGHNENSIKKALKRMNDLGLPRDLENVIFAQLYGMCDQISYPLGRHGYNVCKSVPVGSLEESLPYLSRRAYENKSVMAGIRTELDTLTGALRRRLLG